jgi:hypothetical protein
MLEIVVVLLMMSIIMAIVIGRSIDTEGIDLSSQTDKFRNYFRYARSMAMKSPDTVWGLNCAISGGGTKQFWMFKGADPTAEEIRIPGGEYSGSSTRMNLTEMEFPLPSLTLYFDAIGKPYTAYVDENDNTPLATTFTYAIGGGQSITVEPETGYIK